MQLNDQTIISIRPINRDLSRQNEKEDEEWMIFYVVSFMEGKVIWMTFRAVAEIV